MRAALILICSCFSLALSAADSTAIRFSPAGSGLTRKMEIVQDLSKGWKLAGGGDVDFPWFAPRQAPELIHPVQLSRRGEYDSLWLYLSGISGKCAVWMDNALLWVCEGPHKEWLLPLSPPLPDQPGFLRLQFLESDPSPAQIRTYGIGGDLLLLRSDSVLKQIPVHLKPPGGPVLVLTAQPEVRWIRVWKDLKAAKYFSGIYLPYRPGFALWSALDSAGIALYDTLRDEQPRALFPTAYPGEQKLPLPKMKGLAPYKPVMDRSVLIVLVIFFILGLLFYRVLDPDLFQNFFIHIVKPDSVLRNAIRGNQLLAAAGVVLLRVFLMAFTLSILVHYMDFSGRGESLSLFSANSLLSNWVLSEHPSLGGVFMTMLLGLSCMEFAKIIFFQAGGFIFGRTDLSEGYFHIENAATFPLAFLICLPGILLFFSPAANATAGLWVWSVLMLLYLLRRVIVLYFGLKGSGKVPAGLRILYICALEILPWVIIF